MQFRSLILMGFGASLVASLPALAAPPVAGVAAPEGTAVVQVATKAEQDALKKKRSASAQKPGTRTKTAAKPMTAEQKKAAQIKAEKDKAQQAKLAKEKADREKIAKAKAEKAKQLTAAKAEREKKMAAAKADREKKMAAAKAEREKKIAERAKAAEERKIRLAKESEARKLAREKAAIERRQMAEARSKAAEERRMSKVRAEQERQAQIAAASEAARKAEISRLTAMEVVQQGNNSELRSETVVKAAPKQTGLFAGLFGGQQIQSQASSLLPETRALDAAMEQRSASKPFRVRPEYEPAVVEFSGYKPGTIVIDTAAHRLYLVESSNRARRYAIAVGKEGLQYKGSVKVGDKQEWPRWIPTKEMQQRDPKKYGQYADGMPGGGANPLGARAIYLHQNGRDTYLRIHGTTAPESIGTNSSNGCFRMINEHVMDLYRRVPVGTEVVVL